MRDIGHLVLYETIRERAQSAVIEAGYLGSSLTEVEQSSIGCDYTEVGAELIHLWGMPAQIERAVRYQLCPDEAGEHALHASMVHLAGVIADYSDVPPSHVPQELPFHAAAMKSTRFNVHDRPALLKEAQDQLQETVKLFSPVAMAA